MTLTFGLPGDELGAASVAAAGLSEDYLTAVIDRDGVFEITLPARF